MSEVDGGGAHVREAGPVFQHHAVRTRGRRAVGDLAVLGTYHDPLRRRDLPGRRQAHDRQPRDRHAGTHDLHRRARSGRGLPAVPSRVHDRCVAGARRPAAPSRRDRGDAFGRGADRQQDQDVDVGDPAIRLGGSARAVGGLPHAAYVPVAGGTRRRRRCRTHDGPSGRASHAGRVTTRAGSTEGSMYRYVIGTLLSGGARMTFEHTPIQFPFPSPPTLYHPAPEFASLREERPDGKTGWLVTRHADVRQVLIDPRFSRAAASTPDAPQTMLAALNTDSVMSLDPPEHTRLRKLVARAFTARRVEELRPRVAKLVDELLDALEAEPRPVDLVEHFSLPLPVAVICELLGVPASDRPKFHALSDTLMSDAQVDPMHVGAAFGEFATYFAGLIAGKRAEPADDLLTALIAARDEEDRLSERELVVLGIGLLLAGHETTANQINMFLLTLLHHPEQLAYLRANLDAIAPAVEELMRFVQLGDGGAAFPRVTTEEVELSGVTLPAGVAVLPVLSAANRDPAAFADPDRLDLTRTDNPHVGFGAGVHHCLGAQLARMELQEALRGVLRRLPGLRVAVPDSELRFKSGMIIRSLETLPVTW